MTYKSKLNKFTGKLQVVFDGSLISVKSSVDTYTSLPLSDNSESDLRITRDTDKMYVWTISTSSGLITDWSDIGSVSSVDWSAINNKPTSSVADIDLAVVHKDVATGNPHAVAVSQISGLQTELDEKYDELSVIYDADALLTLLSFEGTDGDTAFTDAVTPALTVAFNGNAELSDGYSKFENTSLSLDGTFASNATLDAVEHFYDDNIDKINVDFWIKFKTTPPSAYTLFSTDDNTASGKRMYCQVNNGTISCSCDGKGFLSAGGFSISDTNVHHFSFVRTNGLGYPATPQYTAVYLDGVLIGSTSQNDVKSHGNRFYIGSSELESDFNNYPNVNAYISDFRINLDDTFSVYNGAGDFDSSFILPTQSANLTEDTTSKIIVVDSDGIITRSTSDSADVEEAATKKHTQNADTILDENGTNEISAANIVKGALEFMIDGGGSAISTGIAGWVEVPFDCTITAVRLTGAPSGSIVVDIWKEAYANLPATIADSIIAVSGSAKPTLSSETKYEDTTLTDWTTSVSAGDFLYFNVDSITTIEKCLVSLTIKRT